MKEYRIVHLLRNNPYRAPNLGLGIEIGDKVFNVDLKTIINKLKAGDKFYVAASGYKAYTEVATHPVTVREYVRTVPDHTKADNLSALPTHLCSGSATGPGTYGWGNPTEAVDLPYSGEGRWLSRLHNTTWPYAADTHGQTPDCGDSIAVGYYDYYDGGYPVGSIWGNVLYRGLVNIDVSGLDKRKIVKAELLLHRVQTTNQIDGNATNDGSALHSVWRLTGPWTEFVDPTLMSTEIIHGVSTWGGTGALSYYDTHTHYVGLDITESVRLWRDAVIPNHGLMLVGPNESEQKNNNSFYSCYDIVSVVVEQEIVIPW
ncbi:DNRLRE domain-containing protein [Dongia sp. agr-C8]